MSRRQENYWSNPSNIDKAFSQLCKKIKRIPTAREFASEYCGAMASLAKGRYYKIITTYNQYLLSHGKNVTRDSNKYNSPAKINGAFDELEKEIGKVPTAREIEESCGGLLVSLRKGRYHPEIKTYNDYLKHRGKLVLHDIGRWSSPNKIDEAFDRLEESLGRTPRRKDFVIKYAGALSAIVQGRYNKNIHYWNEYLMFRNRVINKKSGKDTTLILESLLEEGGTQ
ncbi:hypothetical protein J4461_01525 [Candidatus Pacearchaeota archaeon]|nr:hypothetical protein [Candidatus Pacearchaeota archaeon]